MSAGSRFFQKLTWILLSWHIPHQRFVFSSLVFRHRRYSTLWAWQPSLACETELQLHLSAES